MNKKEVLDKCICKKCPSYINCKELVGFCLARTGKSECIKEESGCICPSCPVTEKAGLMHVYYCTRGSKKEQLK